MQEETNSHLFWQCWYIQELWSKVQVILISNNIEIQLSYCSISFGVRFENNLKNSVFNFVVLLVKYYIFSSKERQQIPNVNGFLTQTRGFEDYMAFQNKVDIHHAKWHLLGIL